MKKFFEELSWRLREGGVESSNVEDRRLEIFLHGQPVLFVSPGNDVFLFPAGSNNPEASELYHRVAQTADEVYTYDNTAMALAELYFQWKDNSKLDYDHEEAIWDKVTGFTASKEALAFLLRQLTDIKNEVPDEDGIREIVDLWKNEDSGEIAPAWLEHLGWLIKRLIAEQEV